MGINISSREVLITEEQGQVLQMYNIIHFEGMRAFCSKDGELIHKFSSLWKCKFI